MRPRSYLTGFGLVFCALFVLGQTGPCGSGASPPGCTSNSDCDDNNGCTSDVCNASRVCVNTALCADELCVSGACVECVKSSDCGPAQVCTDSACVTAENGGAGNLQSHVDAALASTWLVVGSSDLSAFFATAFAVDNRHLATNAHVTEGLRSLFSEPSPAAVVVQHETGVVRNAKRIWSHPDYDPTANSADLGIMEVDGDVHVGLSLASKSAVQQLQTLDEIGLCGFPGELVIGDLLGGLASGELHPIATCLTGTISAIRPFNSGLPATPQNSFLIQYDLPTSHGTSGSAVFDTSGKIVAVNFAGIEGQSYNFGVRSDLLADLRTAIADGSNPGFELVVTQPLPNTPAFICTQACLYANDGMCDDGGPESVTSLCALGSDCLDCGVRGPIGCTLKCSFSNAFCDSDCDGWYDSVEILFGDNPCNASSPGRPPDSPATVCSH